MNSRVIKCKVWIVASISENYWELLCTCTVDVNIDSDM